jgi:hypothetical protein
MTVRQATSIRMALAVVTMPGITCDRRSPYPCVDAPSSGTVDSGEKSIDMASNPYIMLDKLHCPTQEP